MKSLVAIAYGRNKLFKKGKDRELCAFVMDWNTGRRQVTFISLELSSDIAAFIVKKAALCLLAGKGTSSLPGALCSQRSH